MTTRAGEDVSQTGIKETSCPKCGHLLDAATVIDAPETARPSPGDFSICLNCTEILVFDDDCQPVLSLPSDFAKLDTADRRRLIAIQKVTKAFNRGRRRQ